MVWRKHSKEEIKDRILTALKGNVSYVDEVILGVPASHLDEKVFPRGANFLSDAPFLQTMVENPNHIGCHTFGSSEGFFTGTQDIEKEVIRICSEDILKAKPCSIDGYIASGGTEANMEAIWIYRNYFRTEFKAGYNEIAILCSSDSHYSMAKSADILNIPIYKIQVDPTDRTCNTTSIEKAVSNAKENGIKYVIAVSNMMTTMFGSVDDPKHYAAVLKEHGLHYRIHIDGAYGGFYYPFSSSNSSVNFSDPEITSVTLDAHKMAQAPYGTGIFLIRKEFMKYARTEEASYVEGEDCTIIGSRSGANAIAVWMILCTYGPHGWYEKILILQKRTDWLCDQLKSLGIDYYRHPDANIVTMKSSGIPVHIAQRFHLVPDNHHAPEWYKIVLMDHVQIEKLELFIDAIKN